MDYLRNMPAKNKRDLPMIPADARAAEIGAIKVD